MTPITRSAPLAALAVFAATATTLGDTPRPLPPGIKEFRVDGKVYPVPPRATHWRARTHFHVPGESALTAGVTYAAIPAGAATFRGCPVPPGATHAYTEIVYTVPDERPGLVGLLPDGGEPTPPDEEEPGDRPRPPSDADFAPLPAPDPPAGGTPDSGPPSILAPPPPTPPAQPAPPPPAQVMQQRIVAVAAREVDRYADGIGRELRRYPFDLRRYLGRNEAYCSEFVAWCYLVAGYPFTGGSERGGWMKKNTAQITSWFRGRGAFVSKGSAAWRTLVPEPGDYIYYVWSSGYTHSGIVAEVVGDDLRTLEGNIDRKVVALTRKRWRTSRSVRGIGRMRPVFAGRAPTSPSPARLALSRAFWSRVLHADDSRGSGFPGD